MKSRELNTRDANNQLMNVVFVLHLFFCAYYIFILKTVIDRAYLSLKASGVCKKIRLNVDDDGIWCGTRVSARAKDPQANLTCARHVTQL